MGQFLISLRVIKLVARGCNKNLSHNGHPRCYGVSRSRATAFPRATAVSRARLTLSNVRPSGQIAHEIDPALDRHEVDDEWFCAPNVSMFLLPFWSVSPNAYCAPLVENKTRASANEIHPRSSGGKANKERASVASVVPSSFLAFGGATNSNSFWIKLIIPILEDSCGSISISLTTQPFPAGMDGCGAIPG